MANQRLYLDHAATTPMVAEARAAVADAMAHWANPSSPHGEGRKARAMLEDARRRIAAALDWDGEVVLTSGASEAIRIALTGAKAKRLVASPVEHDALMRLARGTQPVPVDGNGAVDLAAAEAACAGDAPALLAVQTLNNETGVVQPLAELAQLARDTGAIWFADATQSAGRMPLPDADLIALSAHKLGGPPGIGALLIRDLTQLNPSGGQEKGYRPGTENLPAAMGFAAALEACGDSAEQAKRRARLEQMRARIDDAVRAAGGAIVADDGDRFPSIASYRLPGLAASAQLIRFDLAGIAISAGSACSSGTIGASHVLTAMGWDRDAASEVIRVSLRHDQSDADVDRFIGEWTKMAGTARHG